MVRIMSTQMHIYNRPRAKQGFTLIELSIVLVIIGLIVGGMLVGQDLIRASQLRTVISDFNNFQTAANTFRLKYNCMPGDCDNATDFFGTAGTCPTTNIAPLTGAATCDGDGNKNISNAEGFLLWHHLANANLVEGTYTGAPGTGGGQDSEIGENVPVSNVTNAGWSINRSVGPAGGSVFFAAIYHNPLMFGASHSTNATYDAVITPLEAFNIDEKVDDGSPSLGNVFGIRLSCTNNSGATDTSATYEVTDSEKQCALIFNNAF